MAKMKILTTVSVLAIFLSTANISAAEPITTPSVSPNTATARSILGTDDCPPWHRMPDGNCDPYPYRYHTVVMQAVIENTTQIRAAINSSESKGNPESRARYALEALTRISTVPASTQDVIRKILAAPSPPPLSDGCLKLKAQLTAEAPRHAESTRQLIYYLNKTVSSQSSCPSAKQRLRLARAILEDGNSTIYNPTWVREHGGTMGGGLSKVPNWVWADLIGGIFDAIPGACIASTISYFDL